MHAAILRDRYLDGVEPLEHAVPVRLDEPHHLEGSKVVRERPVRHLQVLTHRVVVLARVGHDVPVDLAPDEVIEDLLLLQTGVQREDEDLEDAIPAELCAQEHGREEGPQPNRDGLVLREDLQGDRLRGNCEGETVRSRRRARDGGDRNHRRPQRTRSRTRRQPEPEDAIRVRHPGGWRCRRSGGRNIDQGPRNGNPVLVHDDHAHRQGRARFHDIEVGPDVRQEHELRVHPSVHARRVCRTRDGGERDC